jgi:CheY-like chemotaxis protein
MNRNRPIIIIEDDDDDQELLTEAFKRLQYVNELHFFSDGHKALAYLNESDVIPFIILSDINLPKLDGFALRKRSK